MIIFRLCRRLPVLLMLCLAGAAATNAVAETGTSTWVASWGASPFPYISFGGAPAPGPYQDITLRQVLQLSIGGDAVRIRLSNEHGSTPLVIGSASVGLVSEGASVEQGSLQALTFGGEAGVVIPPGAPALSDPVPLAVDAIDQLAVSLYLPESTPASTVHGGRIAYLSGDGDKTLSPTLPAAEQSATMMFLSAVYVERDAPTRVLVALGDSITDGTASTPFSFNSWPDHLARRLADSGISDLAVINQGISGNQVLRDGAGISALARFDRDVLATPGLSHIVVMEGINDIGSGGMAFFGGPGAVAALRTPEDLIAGYQQLIARAHSLRPDVKIFAATLTPFEGTAAPYYSAEKDATRRAVNAWIRDSGAFDGVIDFDRAIQDPHNPDIIRAEYNSGDNLHPGDAGYKHMANSIDLSLFD